MRRFNRVILSFCSILFVLTLLVWAKTKGWPLTRAEAIPSHDTLTLAYPGIKGPIPYKKYGDFIEVGKEGYRYVIKNKKGLAKAAGEGIYPNRDATKDPVYRKLLKAGELEGGHWDFVDPPTAAKNFYKWNVAPEDAGVKQFYTAVMLERAGLIEEAVKAFYAVAVHFPRTFSWTYYKTPWYVGPVSLDRAEQLLRRHPEIKMKVKGGKFTMQGIYDSTTNNDSFQIDPGQLVKSRRRKKEKPVKLSKLKVVKTLRGPKVQLKKYENGHWQLFVDKKPFPVRALTYTPVPVGRSPDRGTWDVSRDWQLVDENKNGVHDGFFESFVDKNGNNRQDEDEPTVGDARLITDMGINTIRAYHHLYNKELFRRLYDEYGLYILVGDLIGGYATGSGALWHEGTDYNNPEHQKNMLDCVVEMVKEYRDEPYVLMWVLGNENVYGVANNAKEFPESFFDFVNRAARMIHELDPTRPVAYANGDILFMDIFSEKCPEVDVFGANVYRGEQGFGRHFFMTVRDLLDRPVLVTEYGASAFADGFTQEEAENFQSMYLANNWEDLTAHMAGRGVGNALGGVLFEFTDGWWKANDDLPEHVRKAKPEWYAEREHIYKNLQPDVQDKVPQFGLPFIDGWSYEEWMGLTSLGNGENSSFVRQLRPAYHTMKRVLNN